MGLITLVELGERIEQPWVEASRGNRKRITRMILSRMSVKDNYRTEKGALDSASDVPITRIFGHFR